ncbi:MAG TPA: DUF4349 domain-containing protein [Acidimicrobiales bacterium]|nr:DUF4349 domain-containing protein [Acidimicrobiales bacterium]
MARRSGEHHSTILDEERLRRGLADAAAAFSFGADRPTAAPAPAAGRHPLRRTPLLVALVVLLVGVVVLSTTRAVSVHQSTLPVRPDVTRTQPKRTAALPPHGPPAGIGSVAQPASRGAPAPSANGAATPPALPAGVVGQPARIEASGTASVTVHKGDLDQTVSSLSALAQADGGFVANSQVSTGGGPPGADLTIQVPEGDFSSVVAHLASFGKVRSLSTKATDVTAQYTDLSARIAALEASRQQYLTIMTKAQTIGDILAVQSQLDDLQSQVEQLQGQQQVLDSETTYASLDVALSEPGRRPPPPPVPQSGVSHAWHQAIHSFGAGLEDLLAASGPVLFALLLLSAVALAGRALFRFIRHRLR